LNKETNHFIQIKEENGFSSEKANIMVNGHLPSMMFKPGNPNVLISNFEVSKKESSLIKDFIISVTVPNSEDSIDYKLESISVEAFCFKGLNNNHINEYQNIKNFDLNTLHSNMVELENFDYFNKKVCFSLANASLPEEKRLLFIIYLTNICLKINGMRKLVEENIDYYNLIRLNVLETNSSELIKSLFSFLEVISNQNYQNSILKLIENLDKLKFTSTGIQYLPSLIQVLKLENSLKIKKLMNMVYHSLKTIDQARFQSQTQTYLKSFMKINHR
jgi:hypothetical protein